jgi:uncharacterized phiE125 gp8 family phage protein
MLSIQSLSLDGAMLDEVKAYLRLETCEEDASLGAILLGAVAHAEAYTRQVLIRREVKETITATPQWQRLRAAPVTAVNGVTGLPADGGGFAIPDAHYKVDLDADGRAHFRVIQPGAAGRVEIAYTAGLGGSWAELPENLRLGILRLAGHLHLHRDAADDAGPPAAVAALLRPYRQLVLS